MRCPRPNCRNLELRTQRSVHPHTESEYPKRFAGTNGVLRRRICTKCGDRITTLELVQEELEAIVRRGYIARTA